MESEESDIQREDPQQEKREQLARIEKDLILRDELAIERTRLARERTQLAYMRTGMSLMLGGVFFIGYFPEGSAYRYVGYIVVIISVAFLAYGFSQHKKTKRFIEPIVDELLEN